MKISENIDFRNTRRQQRYLHEHRAYYVYGSVISFLKRNYFFDILWSLWVKTLKAVSRPVLRYIK